MRILLTGGAGSIGSHAAEHLLVLRSHEVAIR
jgi:nucleoside-diphosphate-sugar epimerase